MGTDYEAKLIQHHADNSDEVSHDYFECASDALEEHIDKLLYGTDVEKLIALELVKTDMESVLVSWWHKDHEHEVDTAEAA